MSKATKVSHAANRIAMRREVIRLALERLGGWLSAPEISDLLAAESLLPHAPLLAGDYILPWTAYSDLLMLQREGRVERHTVNARVVWWRSRKAFK